MLNIEDIKNNYNKIIDDYLSPYDIITKDEINYIVNNLCFDNPVIRLGCTHFKIINNKLYACHDQFKDWETRIEATKYLILETLKLYSIKDCEFIIYTDDAINESNYNKCIYNSKQLPIIITTSVLNKYNMILLPDFTFSFIPEYLVDNNEKMCKEIVLFQENQNYKDKISKMAWRGSSCDYRNTYIKSNDTLGKIVFATSIVLMACKAS